jgi:prophage DNA circulation protein
VDRALQGLPFGGRNILFDPSSGNSLVSGSGLSDFNTVSQTIAPSKIAIVPNALAPDATMLADVAIVQAHAQVHAACAVADALTILFAAEMDTPLMDRSDIEAVTNVTRAGLQTAIDGTRGAMDAEGRGQVAEALREVASAVQEAAQAVINQRPPVVSKPCPISGPVRLVAHQMYGDATRADEISRLNSLGRNVLLQRGDALHVYSI